MSKLSERTDFQIPSSRMPKKYFGFKKLKSFDPWGLGVLGAEEAINPAAKAVRYAVDAAMRGGWKIL
jgi:hypothetical protein